MQLVYHIGENKSGGEPFLLGGGNLLRVGELMARPKVSRQHMELQILQNTSSRSFTLLSLANP